MALAPGTRLGPYEIIAPLGAGGMGEVYRARDSRLQRDVALKLLPTALAGDSEALRRLEQEARTLAALNHPNLLTIFDFGVTPAGAPFLICELLQGETLRERLGQGPLPVREAITLAAAMARGLAAAHGQGIIHRDLKPENIFCTPDGRVKLLDFGLAKLTAAASSDAQTLAAAGTQAGVVLGTLGYMAPEQARGQAADARSDIFGLGAVLYEMFSGQPAFRGPTPADTLSAILREEPPGLTLTAAGLSEPLDRIVRHCLEKNPARRFQSADDLGFALESVGAAHSTTSLQAAAANVPSSQRRRWLFAALGALGLVLAGLGGWALHARFSAASVPDFERLTYGQGQIARALFLPDGHTVVATGILGSQTQWQPFTARLDSRGGLQPLGSSFDTVLAVAGGTAAVLLGAKSLGGFERVGTLALTPVTGGAPRPVLNNIEDAAFAPTAAGAEGSTDALLVVGYHPDTQVRTLEFPPGHVLIQNNGWYSQPRFSPDGTRIAVLEHPQPGDDNGEVLVLDRGGRVLLRGPHFAATQGLAWSPGGREIWYSASILGEGRTVYTLSLGGRNRTLLTGPDNYFVEDTLPNGDLLVRADAMRISGLAVTPQHPEPRDFTVLDWANTGAVTADGKYFLVGDETAGANYATYLEPDDGAPPVQLGPGDAMDISSDDQWALSRDTKDQLWLLPIGAGSPRQLTQGNVIWAGAHFVPGRELIVGEGNAPGRGSRTFLLSWTGQASPLTPEGVSGDRVTPDGKFVLVANSRSGEVALQPLDGGAPRPLRETRATLGTVIRFGADDNTLYVQHPDRMGARVTRLDLASGVEQPMFTLSAAGRPGTGVMSVLGMSADGKSYLYVLNTVLSTLYVVRGLR